MNEEEDSWDSIDWDKKIDDECQHEKQSVKEELKFNLNLESDSGNYFDINKKKELPVHKTQKKSNLKIIPQDNHPFSYKELSAISVYDFHNLIFEIYGKFQKFICTHEQHILSDECMLILLKIDVILMQVPIINHNLLLLKQLSKLESFWIQIVKLIERFFALNYKDPKYLLLFDMKGFFENIESLISWMVVHNLFHNNLNMKDVLMKILQTIEAHVDKNFDYIDIIKIQTTLHSYNEFTYDADAFDIFPTLSNLIESQTENLIANNITMPYENVFHYTKIQLPLLKEDFMCKLRNGFKCMTNLDSCDNRVSRLLNDAIIYPNVKIQIKFHQLWSFQKCPIITVKTNGRIKLFNGQLVCFTSNKFVPDLIVATVLKTSQLDVDENTIIIEIIKMENIDEIFDRNLIMIEAKTFFDPYYQVHTTLKNLNEHNFPFSERILHIKNYLKFPSYGHHDCYEYKQCSLNPHSIDSWREQDLGLNNLQVDAVFRGISNDFSLIVGPPGEKFHLFYFDFMYFNRLLN
jgi:hypothetical protein